MRQTRTTTVALATTLLALAAGCGGSNASRLSGSQSSPQAMPSSTFPLTAANTAAKAALLQLSDFPTGWSTDTDTSDSEDDAKFMEQLSTCLHAPPGLLGRGGNDAANVDSPNYDSPDGNLTVSETVTVASTAKVEKFFAALGQPSATRCVADTLNTFLKAEIAKSKDPDVRQATFGDVKVGSVNFPSLGDGTIAMRATLPVSAGALTIDLYVDVVFVRHANAAAILNFENEGEAFDVDQMQHYAEIALQRLTAANVPAA